MRPDCGKRTLAGDGVPHATGLVRNGIGAGLLQSVTGTAPKRRDMLRAAAKMLRCRAVRVVVAVFEGPG